MTDTDTATQAKFQRLRLQRFLMAQLNYLITYVVIITTWLFGEYHGTELQALSHILIGFGTQAVFLWLLISNLNLKFRDPSMTVAQIVVATLLLTYMLVYVGELRGSMTTVYAIILLFGVFQLSRRAFVVCSGFALACFGSLIILEPMLLPEPAPVNRMLLQWFLLACFLAWVSMFCSYIRDLRERLQMRHNTLQVHQETLKGMMGQLESLATTDGLTGLLNRRTFYQEADRRLTLLTPGKTAGLAVIDLDHFKQVNDTYGHDVGDKVLKSFAQIARESLREDDLLARFGGEEFILLIHHADVDLLNQCVERIRQRFAQTRFAGLPEDYRCTLSAGLSLLGPGDRLDERIRQADQALYAAKAAGRNCSQISDAAYA
ncbi:GGDEF domain-containing protein [Halopseudomonas salegens]|uniref:diguanylate cyclase n=1 Tax=Halopseudomonas salegens TaxID=1434072 RepID=A0A1H2FWG1_9GAMM|nr:GGDEF domain-containing protein [Halopseudomonas salegens]SDU11691.1 diguanylate cyclase (GGDEF) domain-containing protein [Halopseudomonas salegens]